MKETFSNKVLRAVAKAVLNTAIRANGSASYWGCHQPKEPDMVKILRNKK